MTKTEARHLLDIPENATREETILAYKLVVSRECAGFSPPLEHEEAAELSEIKNSLWQALKILFPDVQADEVGYEEQQQPKEEKKVEKAPTPPRPRNKGKRKGQPTEKIRRQPISFPKVRISNVAQKMLAAFLALAFACGVTAFLVSAFLELLAVENFYTLPGGGTTDLAKKLSGTAIFIVFAFEGMKAASVFILQYWKEKEFDLPSSFEVLMRGFQVAVFTFSLCCSIMIVKYVLDSAYKDNANTELHTELEKREEQELRTIKAERAEKLNETQRKIDQECGTGIGPKCQALKADLLSWREYYDKKESDAKKSFEQKRKKANINRSRTESAAHESENKFMAAFVAAFRTMGIKISYELAVLVFSILISVTLELIIYLSMKMVSMELFREKPDNTTTAYSSNGHDLKHEAILTQQKN